jgi:hypothetical protein
MVFKNFYSQIGLRLSLLVVSVIFTSWLVVSGQKLIFSLNFLALSILQFGWLLWYLNKWNRELYDFFRGLKESSYEIPRHLGWKWIRPIEQPLTELKEYLRKQQEQKEVENEYYSNFWNDKTIGNKHYMFMLKDCINDETPNGFFNEFLPSELLQYKGLFAMIGDKMKVDKSDNQLSGLGFSSTKPNSLIVKVDGYTSRVMKIVF